MRSVFLDNLAIGAEALRIHPMRTLLSVLGILIGSAALVATMAVSDGLVVFAREQVQRETSVQVISISPRTSYRENGEWKPVRDYPVFTNADANALLRQLDGARSATLVLGGGGTAVHRGERRATGITLGTASLPDFGRLELGAGRFFGSTEAERNHPVVVINYALARELHPGADPFDMVGRDIRVNDRTRRVVGVLAATGFEDADDPACRVIAPIRAARALLPAPPGRRPAPTLQVLAASLEDVDRVEAGVHEWLSRRWPDWPRRVRVTVGRQQLEEVERGLLVLEVFAGALVGISLLVGGIGIMNVLLAAVTERTREIGIRKSVGARASDIRTQFLAESVAIALAGSLAGLVVGFLIAVAVTAVFRAFVHAPVTAVLSWQAVAIATLSSSFVGLAFGTYPARRAARLSPIAAIAHE